MISLLRQAFAGTMLTDAHILAGCRRREEVAWRALYDAHFDFVYRTARRLGTPEAEAEELVHEVFMVAWRKLDTFEEGRITTWLYRICANIVSDHHRRRRVRESFARLRFWDHAEPPPTPEETAVRSSARAAVEEILARMSPRKREVLALFELEGLEGDVIAERLGCPTATVWTRLHHARKEFKKIAQRLGHTTLEEVL